MSPRIVLSDHKASQALRRAARAGDPLALPIELTDSEINSLLRVRSGLANFLPGARRVRLASLGLIAVNGGGRLVLTQGGKDQLAERKVARWDSRT